MKVDLSIPAVREVVEYFSATLKQFRDREKRLRLKNQGLTYEAKKTRELLINTIMKLDNCDSFAAASKVNTAMSGHSADDYIKSVLSTN